MLHLRHPGACSKGCPLTHQREQSSLECTPRLDNTIDKFGFGLGHPSEERNCGDRLMGSNKCLNEQCALLNRRHVVNGCWEGTNEI